MRMVPGAKTISSPNGPVPVSGLATVVEEIPEGSLTSTAWSDAQAGISPPILPLIVPTTRPVARSTTMAVGSRTASPCRARLAMPPATDTPLPVRAPATAGLAAKNRPPTPYTTTMPVPSATTVVAPPTTPAPAAARQSTCPLTAFCAPALVPAATNPPLIMVPPRGPPKPVSETTTPPPTRPAATRYSQLLRTQAAV